jgi:hypothetical protein
MEKGYALILAWPDTKCKQAGAWYDPIMKQFRINKSGYYRIGHAAVVLIHGKTGKCHYFDFGRYHAPVGHGRVRSELTDHDLVLSSQIRFDEFRIPNNLKDLLSEIQDKEECHGEGKLAAGITEVDFNKSLAKAIEMQDREFIPYGPFVKNGTNCSRFVQHVAVSGLPFGWMKFSFKYPIMITPTPKWNTIICASFLKKLVRKQEEIYELT